MDVYVKGSSVRLDPKAAIGKGGEADIFDIGGGLVAKIYKPPTHPDFAGAPQDARGAAERIAEHQKKLLAFPRNLPARVVTPRDLVTDRTGRQIIGYTMPRVANAEVLYLYGERSFREKGIATQTVLEVFRDLWQTVLGVHRAGVVIGDFNDLNVLVRGVETHLIDADSMQFGPFFSRVFTTKFVDPLLCNPRSKSPELSKPYGTDSDWYAFAVMFMQCLLFTGPYGGVYRPKDPKKLMPHDARSLHRITVWNPDVRYPKPAISWTVLPDDLLHYFHKVFLKDERGEFPRLVLDGLRWTKCVACGAEHGRAVCPSCATSPPSAVKSVTVVRGKVMATRIFQTRGLILFAAIENGELKWVYHENDALRREDKSDVVASARDPHLRIRISGKRTILAKEGRMVTIERDTPSDTLAVDSFGALPVFHATGTARFWAAGGKLWRDGMVGPELVGDVLAGQTLFWVGSEFGFGMWRAGTMAQAFLFDATRRGINDSVKIPPVRGQLIDATAVFGTDRVWFFTTSREGGRTINRCTLLGRDGAVQATAEAENGDGSWLGKIRGNCAVGAFLFSATDDGIVRVEESGGMITKTREFPDTEPFVDVDSQLFAGKLGIYVVDRQEIKVLRIS